MSNTYKEISIQEMLQLFCLSILTSKVLSANIQQYTLLLPA